jgi:hypothetical protein
VTEPTRVFRDLVLPFIVVLAAVACSDDDPDPARTYAFPGDGETLADVVALARDGDTVRIGAGNHAVSDAVTVSASITIVGRNAAGADEARPTLTFEMSDRSGLEVRSNGVVVRGLRINGAYRDGVSFLGTVGRVVDCELRGAGRDAIVFAGPAAGGEVEENLIVAAARFGVSSSNGADPIISRNTIVATGDCGLYTSDSAPDCERNIIVDSANFGIACFGETLPDIGCNVLFNNATADYSGGCPASTGDILADPMFCDPDTFTLDPRSPAADGIDCGWIGAVPETCGP